MSMISTYNKYSMYSDLITSTYSNSYNKSYSSSMANTASSLLGMYSNIYASNNVNTSQNTKEYVVDVKENSTDLLNSINSLNEKGSKSLFNKVSATSDSSAVSAGYEGEQVKNDKASIKVGVSQIATAQKNVGTEIEKGISSIYKSGERKVNITTAKGKEVSFSISVGLTDTTETIQKRIAEQVNKSDLGITATVTKNSKGATALVLEGKETGRENSFSVTGDLAEKLGINSASQQAQDAVYTINGETNQSSSNKVKLDDGTTLKFNATTKKDANISYKNDTLNPINATRSLVNGFNALIDTAYKYDDAGAKKLSDQLSSTARVYGSSLARIGVTFNSKGYLEIDEEKMQKAADSGELSKFFNADSKNKINYGFVNRLESIAEKAQSDPTNYLSNQAEDSIKTTAYSVNKPVSNNYINSYYKYSATAMLLDTLF